MSKKHNNNTDDPVADVRRMHVASLRDYSKARRSRGLPQDEIAAELADITAEELAKKGGLFDKVVSERGQFDARGELVGLKDKARGN